jgi:hypothetical protein
VEDGIPFCAHCNAPQIRVAPVEPIAPPAVDAEAALELPEPHPVNTLSALDWAQSWRSAAIAVLVSMFLILLGMPAGFGMAAAGFLAVMLYHRRRPLAQLTAGRGAGLGALTGALGFGVFAVVLALVSVFRSGSEIHDALLKYLQQYAATSSDPRMQQVLDLVKTPDGYIVILVLGLAVTFLAFLIFGSLGGAMGAFLLHRRERR